MVALKSVPTWLLLFLMTPVSFQTTHLLTPLHFSSCNPPAGGHQPNLLASTWRRRADKACSGDATRTQWGWDGGRAGGGRASERQRLGPANSLDRMSWQSKCAQGWRGCHGAVMYRTFSRPLPNSPSQKAAPVLRSPFSSQSCSPARFPALGGLAGSLVTLSCPCLEATLHKPKERDRCFACVSSRPGV